MKGWEQHVGRLGGGARAVLGTFCTQCGRITECDLRSCREVRPGRGAA